MSSDIEVAGNDVSNHGHSGIVAGFSRRISILSNKVSLNGGQAIPKCNPPVVLGSSPDIQGYGIGLICDTNNSRVENNETDRNKSHGILLDTVFANHVGANLVKENDVGIGLLGSTDNRLEGNRVLKNADYGIRLERGSPHVNPSVGNTVLANDLDDNGINAFDTSGKDTAPAKVQGTTKGGPVDATMLRSANRWDDGSRGNHHSDFDSEDEGFIDADADGIGEKARLIPGGKAADRFPLARSSLAIPDVQ
jgi:parallel beta-helix repeat protein